MKKILYSLFALILALGVVLVPAATAAATLVDDNNGTVDGLDLEELFILEILFNRNGDQDREFNWEEWFVLNELDEERVVVVQPGDTLSGIAAQFLGDASRFPEIAAINNLADPNVIRVGQRLTLPENGDNGLFGGDTDLEELFILEELFNNGVNGLFNGEDRDSDRSWLFEFFILDELFEDDTGKDDDFNLEDLFILEWLFGNNNQQETDQQTQ